jgi:tetratricopeptide (TPR) repeat protein
VRPGDVFDDRFRIEAIAGVGGSGEVYRAIDLARAERVALKLIHSQSADAEARFSRETAVLAELTHPRIVRYVGQGVARTGQPYLMMEWLEGESLSAYLRRTPPTIEESLRIVRHVAEGLGCAHRQGVVHRDVKPSNVFLVGGEIDGTKVLDFGIARRMHAVHDLTLTGQLVGTFAYMAPEQALADHAVAPAADVFSLGCVLFQCLTGRKPFQANDLTAVLAKLLLEEPPLLRALVPDAPAALEALLSRMLAKKPAQRIADAAELIDAIDALDPDALQHVSRTPTSSLARQERQVVLVVVASGPDDRWPDASVQTASSADDRTHVMPEADLFGAIDALGGRLDVLANGAHVATVLGAGPPSDLAARAARCALAFRERASDARVSVCAGLAVVRDTLPLGDVIDRAALLAREGRPGQIAIDATTGGLLDARFLVHADEGALWLDGEMNELDGQRLLLGQPTPFVGRDRERAWLESIWDECVAEPAARVVLVTAPAGAGKSRLRHEFFLRLAARGTPVQLLVARGDPLRAGAPFALLGDAIRRTARILDGDTLDVRRDKLQVRMFEVLPDQARATAAFLGEAIGTPFEATDDAMLRAARRDVSLMTDFVRAAFTRWLAAECARGPVLLVLDDLHWGDAASVRLVDVALRSLERQPFFVLALSRPARPPELDSLGREAGLIEIRLPRLPTQACAALVRSVLGADTTDVEVGRLAQVSEGNAFFLEELIRARKTEGAMPYPESIVAMAQARLQAFDDEARRLLRAASLFGGVFWRDGVQALIGDVVDRRVDELLRAEILTRRPTSKYAGDMELAFRHDLLREAAYAMLTDDDRRLGHRLVAEWLERKGSQDALVLAEHFRRGEVRDRALQWFLRAARHALASNDSRGAIAHAREGLRCDPDPASEQALLLVLGEAERWLGHYADGAAHVRQVLERATRGSAVWFAAIEELAGSFRHAEAIESLEAWVAAAEAEEVAPELVDAKLRALSQGIASLLQAGRYRFVEQLMRSSERLASGTARLEPQTLAMWSSMRAAYANHLGDPLAFLRASEACLRAAEELGDVRGACAFAVNVAYASMGLGAYAEAERLLRATLARARDAELELVAGYASQNLSRALLHLGALDEARHAAESAVQVGARLQHPRLEGGSRTHLALVLLAQGDVVAAETQARSSLELLVATPPIRMRAAAVLSQALARAGRAREALEQSRRAIEWLDAAGGAEDGELLILMAHARNLVALGLGDEAQQCVARARTRLDRSAAFIEDASLRTSFLHGVPLHADVLAWSTDRRALVERPSRIGSQ